MRGRGENERGGRMRRRRSSGRWETYSHHNASHQVIERWERHNRGFPWKPGTAALRGEHSSFLMERKGGAQRGWSEATARNKTQ